MSLKTIKKTLKNLTNWVEEPKISRTREIEAGQKREVEPPKDFSSLQSLGEIWRKRQEIRGW